MLLKFEESRGIELQSVPGMMFKPPYLGHWKTVLLPDIIVGATLKSSRLANRMRF